MGYLSIIQGLVPPALPDLDNNNGIWHSWWFEPLVATASFAVFINLYWYHERIRGLSSNKTFLETVEFSSGPMLNSFLAYWAGIYLFKIVVPPAAPSIPDGIPHSINDLLYLLTELISGIVAYDAIFFFVHWSMHELPFLQRIHRNHHVERFQVESQDVLKHSLLDGSLQVLVNILVQRHTPWGWVKSRLARCLHNIVVVWMLVESHTASPYPNIWRRYFVGVREHRLHHMMGTNKLEEMAAATTMTTSTRFRGKHTTTRYQQFFGYLDDIRPLLLCSRHE